MKKGKAINAIFWNTLGMGLSSTISLFLLIFVTRINGIDLSGTFSFFFSFCLIIYTLTLYGGRIYQVSDFKNEYSYNEYYSLKIITSFLSIFILLVYLYISGGSQIEYVISFSLLLVKIFDAFSDSIYGSFQKNNRLDLVGKSLSLKTTLSVVGFITVDFLTKSLIYSVIVYMLLNLLVFLFFDKKQEKKYEIINIKISKKVFRLILVTKYIFLNNLITNIMVNVPRFIIKTAYSATELGYFGILIMIPTVLGLFGQFIVQPILVYLTESYSKKQKKKFNKYINISIKYVVIITIICSFLAYFLGPEVLGILYNVDFNQYRWSLVFLVLGGSFNVICYILSTGLNVFRKMKFQTIVYSSILFISIIIFNLVADYLKFETMFVFYAIIMLIQLLILYSYYLFQQKKIFK